MRAQDFVLEINAPGELSVDPDLIRRFTDRGWQIDGEGRDQIVLSRPNSNTVLKIVGSGSLPRRAEIRRYVTFCRAHQRNPHFPRVGPDREIQWNGRRYYAYTQERLRPLSGEEAIMDYLEYAMGEIGHGESPDYDRIPPGLTVEQIDGLVMAIDALFASGIATEHGFDLGNVANIMQRANGQLVIVDPVSSFDDELTEVKILSKVKGKGADLSNLPRSGGRIPNSQETRYLGRKQADLDTYEIWLDHIGGQMGYHLYDPETRRVMITAFGSRYQRNPHSFIIGGLYAAPGNPVRAAEFYRALIQDLGLTLISDRKQSPGGQRVWQQLEAFPDIEIYGYDTRTGEVMNFGPQDSEMYAIASGDVKDREGRYIANNIRMVATAR